SARRRLHPEHVRPGGPGTAARAGPGRLGTGHRPEDRVHACYGARLRPLLLQHRAPRRRRPLSSDGVERLLLPGSATAVTAALRAGRRRAAPANGTAFLEGDLESHRRPADRTLVRADPLAAAGVPQAVGLSPAAGRGVWRAAARP